MGKTKYAAFDLEIAKSIPDGLDDWSSVRPLGISCAAIATDKRIRVWQGSPKLTKEECQEMVSAMTIIALGHTIVGWNSLGFDFDVLAEESGYHMACREMALNHVDMMFQVFCLRGHALGLDKACRGMGLAGKTDGMDGAKAPDMWARGERHKVVEYLKQDVSITLQLAKAVERKSKVAWASAKGNTVYQHIEKWLKVSECLDLPEPDVSWMDDPWRREKFTGWLGDPQLRQSQLI